jgi:hypothetical protein
MYQKEVVRQPGKNGQKPFTEARFSISTVGDDGVFGRPRKRWKGEENLQL